MRALFVYLLITLVSFNSFSESAPVELPPLDPAYFGEHGMVLLNKSSAVFAYHSPSYQKPHDVQLLYRLRVTNVAFLLLVRDSEMVTIKTKPFNLQRLMRGETLALEADVYIGHFEHDGMLVYENMTLNFAKQLYFRKLDEINPSSNQQVYDVLSYSKTNKIYIHRLQQPPSYDHLIHIDQNAACLTKFNTSSHVPKRIELQYKFFHCGTIKPLYYETQDFEIK
jgi:hypothetical protein